MQAEVRMFLRPIKGTTIMKLTLYRKDLETVSKALTLTTSHVESLTNEMIALFLCYDNLDLTNPDAIKLLTTLWGEGEWPCKVASLEKHFNETFTTTKPLGASPVLVLKIDCLFGLGVTTAPTNIAPELPDNQFNWRTKANFEVVIHEANHIDLLTNIPNVKNVLVKHGPYPKVVDVNLSTPNREPLLVPSSLIFASVMDIPGVDERSIDSAYLDAVDSFNIGALGFCSERGSNLHHNKLVKTIEESLHNYSKLLNIKGPSLIFINEGIPEFIALTTKRNHHNGTN